MAARQFAQMRNEEITSLSSTPLLKQWVRRKATQFVVAAISRNEVGLEVLSDWSQPLIASRRTQCHSVQTKRGHQT